MYFKVCWLFKEKKAASDADAAIRKKDMQMRTMHAEASQRVRNILDSQRKVIEALQRKGG